MLQQLEIISLEFLRWFYQQGVVVGVLTLGLGMVALLLIQFLTRSKNFIPGIFALLLGTAELLHAVANESVVNYIDGLLQYFSAPHPVPTIPGLEPVFEILVASADRRFLFEEVFFVAFSIYMIFVVIHSFAEYRKTGVIFGDLSPVSLFQSKNRRPERSKSNELGSGDLADTEQISQWTKGNNEPGDTALPVRDLRGSQGAAMKSGYLILPREERNRHVLVVAKTGSGKTTRLILPILYSDCLDPLRSTIILDAKPEMWSKLAGLTKKYNPEKQILLFNPLDRARSLSWNILGKIEDDTDAKLIANTVILATDVPSAKSDSPFFRNNALALLNAVMVGLLHDPDDTLSMPRIHQLVQSGMKPLCDWLEARPHAIRNTRAFVELARSGSQNADTIMSELSMRLSAWDLEAIRATTAKMELDLDSVVDKPTLFIIELRESEVEMLRPMANVIIVEILRYLTKRAEQCKGVTLPRPVGLVIDEFASALGRLPDIHVKLNTLRSRNVSIVAAIQSIAQIKANYGDDADSVLAGFSTKIFMPALDLQDAEWASKETGQMTIRFKTASTGSNKKLVEWFASKNDGSQEQVQQRAVLTPDEIGRPADNISTFFLPNTAVFQGFLVPFFKIPEMLKRINASENLDVSLRDSDIVYEEILPEPAPTQGSPAAGGTALPAGISDTTGWDDKKILDTLEETKKKLDWENTTGSAKKWWEAFEEENKHRHALVLRLAEELAVREATITEFFLAYVYSNTDNIQANLSYLDYTRLKRQEEKRKREAEQSADTKKP